MWTHNSKQQEVKKLMKIIITKKSGEVVCEIITDVIYIFENVLSVNGKRETYDLNKYDIIVEKW